MKSIRLATTRAAPSRTAAWLRPTVTSDYAVATRRAFQTPVGCHIVRSIAPRVKNPCVLLPIHPCRRRPALPARTPAWRAVAGQRAVKNRMCAPQATGSLFAAVWTVMASPRLVARTAVRVCAGGIWVGVVGSRILLSIPVTGDPVCMPALATGLNNTGCPIVRAQARTHTHNHTLVHMCASTVDVVWGCRCGRRTRRSALQARAVTTLAASTSEAASVPIR